MRKFGAILIALSLLYGVLVPVELTRAEFVSTNWSGYTLQGKFTEVSGTFIVPSASGDGTAAVWVGVDGYSDKDLIQAGVEESCDNTIGCFVTPWWEILPSAEQNLYSLPVKVGDQVTVTIREVTANHWLVALLDKGAFQWSHVFPYNGPASSVEWITEAPTVGGTIATLPNLGLVRWISLQTFGRVNHLQRVILKHFIYPEPVYTNVRALMTGHFYT